MIDPDPRPQDERDERDDIEDVGEESSRRLEPVSYFGTDFDVHGLVRRLNAGEVVIPSFDPR